MKDKYINIDQCITNALKGFVLIEDERIVDENQIKSMDKTLLEYDQLFLDPEIEKNLISKNEFLTSFGISKAEESTLTIPEAEEVYEDLGESSGNFVALKIKQGKKITQKDYEKLEFYNIARTFRELNRTTLSLDALTPEFILNLHAQLTRGMDVFKKHLVDFQVYPLRGRVCQLKLRGLSRNLGAKTCPGVHTVYQSGKWRNNNLVRVRDYVPVDFALIESGVSDLILWFKKSPSVTNVAIFHAALYALHPFQNGNKRVCRMLEHILLRALDLNARNLYSSSYYYHKEKERYYKNLLASLERKNLTHFVAFILEAIVFSMIAVLKTSLETKRDRFLVSQELSKEIRGVLKPLIKRREVQFKNLYSRIVKKKMARQTFVNSLNEAVAVGAILRREDGKKTFYRLNVNLPEEPQITDWLGLAKNHFTYIPDNIRLT